MEGKSPRAVLRVLLTCMIDYIMAVKSAPAGRFSKSFGEWWLGPFRGCDEDAIFCDLGVRRGTLLK